MLSSLACRAGDRRYGSQLSNTAKDRMAPRVELIQQREGVVLRTTMLEFHLDRQLIQGTEPVHRAGSALPLPAPPSALGQLCEAPGLACERIGGERPDTRVRVNANTLRAARPLGLRMSS